MTDIGAYLSEFSAVTLPSVAMRTVTPAQTQAVRDALQAAEDQAMWTLDAKWLATATFADQTRCVRVAEFTQGYRSDPFVNGGCRNWAGSTVPPSCSWGVWRVAGCDHQTLLRALFQLPRYLWAQKKMTAMIASKPTERQFGPVLGDALASWVNDSYALVSALVYSTNIRFDDDGAANWPDTYEKALRAAGVLAPAATAVARPRFYNNLGTRKFLGSPEVKEAYEVRAVPVSKADFEPVVDLPPAPSSAHWESEVNTVRTSGTPLEKLRALAKYFPELFARVVAEAEPMIRHYSTLSYFAWQRAAVGRWLTALDSLRALATPDHARALDEMRANASRALEALSTIPEASLRTLTAEEASNASGGGPYAGLVAGVAGAVNGVAGAVLSIVQLVLNALTGWIVEAAGAATGRPTLCPAVPYIRIFDQADCTIDIERELDRLENETGAPPAPPPASTSKSGGGLLIAVAAAGLLLSRLR